MKIRCWGILDLELCVLRVLLFWTCSHHGISTGNSLALGVRFGEQADVSMFLIGCNTNMAASLLSRCVCQRTRSFFTKVSRSSAARLCTNATDGNQENSDLLKSQKSETTSESTHGERALAGFAKALEKARVEVVTEDDVADDTETEHTTFAAMLRHSKLMQLGDYAGRMVVGTVIEVVGDDLYVDFGGKFHCVCPRPKLNSE